MACGACEAEDVNGGESSICVVKLDPNGNHLWTQFVGEGERLKSYTIAATPGGGILVNAYHKVEDDYDAYLIQLNESGEEIWQKSLANYGFDYAFDMKVNTGGNIFLAGDTDGQSLPILAKLETDGNLIWKEIYQGKAGNYRAYALAFTKDKGVILAGRTTEAKGFLLKTDQKGQQQWVKLYTGIEKASLQDVVELKDGGFVAVGVTMGNRILTSYVIRTGAEGN